MVGSLSPQGDVRASARLALHSAKTEVDTAKRVPPAIGRDVAPISLDSPCQIHPLIAQQGRGRLKDKIVIAANADGRYGNGHAQATGGALRTADWNDFIRGFGFPQAQVQA